MRAGGSAAGSWVEGDDVPQAEQLLVGIEFSFERRLVIWSKVDCASSYPDTRINELDRVGGWNLCEKWDGGSLGKFMSISDAVILLWA